jgi:hypothetical protein
MARHGGANISERVEQLNLRFHRVPYRATGWETLPDAAILVHQLDNWEDPKYRWRGRVDVISPWGMCTSLIHAGQLRLGTQPRIPLDPATSSGGFVMRPGATPITCAKSRDSMGACTDWCPSPPTDEEVTLGLVRKFRYDVDGNGDGVTSEGDACFKPLCEGSRATTCKLPNDNRMQCQPCSWRVADIGQFLWRQGVWQSDLESDRDLVHNEFVTYRDAWNAALPWSIDAVFMERADGKLNEGKARAVQRDLLKAYPSLSAADVPLVVLDRDDWEAPFSGAPERDG